MVALGARFEPTEAPSLHRRYPASPVLLVGPLRHPERPDLTLAGCRLARATPPPGLPVLRPFPSSTRAAAITPAEPVGARVARFPTAVSLPASRLPAGSASAIIRFEACSAFTRVAVAVGNRVTPVPPRRSVRARTARVASSG